MSLMPIQNILKNSGFVQDINVKNFCFLLIGHTFFVDKLHFKSNVHSIRLKLSFV